MATKPFSQWLKDKHEKIPNYDIDKKIATYKQVKQDRLKYNRDLLYHTIGFIPITIFTLVVSILLSALTISFMFVSVFEVLGYETMQIVLNSILYSPTQAFVILVTLSILPICYYVIIYGIVMQWGNFASSYDQKEKELMIDNDKEY